MDIRYSSGQAGLKARARAFVTQLKAFEDECEDRGHLTEESRLKIKQIVLESGFNAMNAPVHLSGAGMNWVDQVVVEEELGQLTNGLWAAAWRPTAALLLAASPEQRDRYLIPEIRGDRFGGRAVTEPGAGSDPSLIATTAQRTENGYRINGEKWFVTLGDIADYFVLLARTVPDGAPTMFLVDRNLPGVEMADNPRYTHRFAYAHPHFRFVDVDVPADAVLGSEGEGFRLSQATFFEERVLVAAHAVGAAERALTLAADWARERVQGGDRIIRHQMIQAMLADSAIDIALNRAFVYQVAADIDRGCDLKTLNAKVAMAKISATEAAGRVADRAVQIFGGRGYLRDNPVERINRDVRVDRIWMGTSEVQRLVVANEIDKRGPAGLLHFASEETA